MAVVTKGLVLVDGMVVGTVDESKYEIPSVISVEYDRPTVYVIGGGEDA